MGFLTHRVDRANWNRFLGVYVLAFGLSSGCSKLESSGFRLAQTASAPQKVQIPNDLKYWENSGFAEMVPPVRLPSDKEHLESIRVWLKIPDGEKISVTWLDSQKRYSLVY